MAFRLRNPLQSPLGGLSVRLALAGSLAISAVFMAALMQGVQVSGATESLGELRPLAVGDVLTTDAGPEILGDAPEGQEEPPTPEPATPEPEPDTPIPEESTPVPEAATPIPV
jgi:hypothetical protein